MQCYMKSSDPTQPKGRQKRPAVKQRKAALKPGAAKGVNVSPKFVGSLVALADELGVARQTLTRWHREPGNPGKRSDGRYEVAAWWKFLLGRSRYGGGAEGYAAKCENIRLHCEKLEIEIAALKGRYVPKKHVAQWAAELVDKIRTVVSIIPRVAPEVVACTVPQAEARLKRLEDEILTQLHTLGSK